jgi:large subunit ribosomal protein L30
MTEAVEAQPAGAEGRLYVTQVRSAIGSKPKHRGTLRALGLGRIGRTHELPDRPEIRGMVARVNHLVEVRTSDEVDVEGAKK